jgi:hypothetical protein
MPEPHPEVRYEQSDAQFGIIFATGAGMLVAAVIIHLAVAWLFDFFREEQRLVDTPLPSLAAEERPQLPRDLPKIPAPVLQQNEVADLERLRQDEDKSLKSVGEAMRLLGDPKTAEAHGLRVETGPKKGGR